MRRWLLLLFLAGPLWAEESPERARTEGTFHLTYDLARKDGEIYPDSLKVTVRNRQKYFHPPDQRLREHEDVHAKINENGARKMEQSLRKFRAKGSMAEAEKKLRKFFKQEVQKVRALHEEWDKTHMFVVPKT